MFPSIRLRDFNIHISAAWILTSSKFLNYLYWKVIKILMVTFILPESPFNNVLPRLEMTHRQPIPAIINPDCFPTWPHYCFPLPCLVDLQIKLIAFHDVSQATLLEINSISHASQMLRYAEFLQPSKPVSVQILIKWLLF